MYPSSNYSPPNICLPHPLPQPQGVLPTLKFLKSNLVTPENFVQFCPSV